MLLWTNLRFVWHKDQKCKVKSVHTEEIQNSKPSAGKLSVFWHSQGVISANLPHKDTITDANYANLISKPREA